MTWASRRRRLCRYSRARPLHPSARVRGKGEVGLPSRDPRAGAGARSRGPSPGRTNAGESEPDSCRTGRTAHRTGPGLPRRRHARAARPPPGAGPAGLPGRRRPAERHRGRRGGHRRLRRPRRSACGPRPRGPPSRTGGPGDPAAGRGPGRHRRPPRPHGDRPGPAGSGTDDSRDRHAVLPVLADAGPPLTRGSRRGFASPRGPAPRNPGESPRVCART